MGWDSGYVPKSVKTIDYLRDYWTDDGRWECLAIGTGVREHGQSVYYAAVKVVATGEVFAGITLVKRSHGELAKKTGSEDEGYGYHDCPAKVFKLLTPTTNAYAIEWRAKVAEHLAKKKATPKVVVGSRVVFTHPIKFTDGSELKDFIFLGRNRFKAALSNGYSYTFRISAWKARDYQVAI
jgi:hypothetical protein